MIVTDFSAGETATELQKQLVLVSAKSWKYKSISDKLIDLIENIQPTIWEIQYSGVELSPHRQAQIGMLSNTLKKGKNLTEKVLSSRRWNMYRQFYLARKMEILEKSISDFIKSQISVHILENVIALKRSMELEKSVEMKQMEALKSISELVDITVHQKRTSINFPMDCTVQPPQIQVFINFRGAQLRNNFMGYLVDALQKSEVNVFTDNYLTVGDDLDNLLKKIEDSGIAIVVFSTRYTESEWCLNELVKIDERVNQGLLKVIPIFYKVTPTNVKRLKGKFGDNFRDQEYEFRSDEPKIKRWKEALESVSHKRGLTFDEKSAPEIDFIGNIVKEVLRMLQDISAKESNQSFRCVEKSKLMLTFDGEVKKYHPKNVSEITRILSDLSV